MQTVVTCEKISVLQTEICSKISCFLGCLSLIDCVCLEVSISRVLNYMAHVVILNIIGK